MAPTEAQHFDVKWRLRLHDIKHARPEMHVFALDPPESVVEGEEAPKTVDSPGHVGLLFFKHHISQRRGTEQLRNGDRPGTKPSFVGQFEFLHVWEPLDRQLDVDAIRHSDIHWPVAAGIAGAGDVQLTIEVELRTPRRRSLPGLAQLVVDLSGSAMVPNVQEPENVRPDAIGCIGREGRAMLSPVLLVHLKNFTVKKSMWIDTRDTPCSTC